MAEGNTVMRGSAWRPIRGIDHGRLREARVQAHHAVQWLARAARAFVPPHPDDIHTNLGWDDALDGFTTHRLTGDMHLGLRIADLTLLFGGHGGPDRSFALDGRTDADARRWLDEQLRAQGLDARRLDAPSPYEMPAHAIAKGAAYGGAGLADALAELAAWFADADGLLGGIREQMTARGLAASPVRCWPHHFDIAALTLLDQGGSAEHARSVNAGMSPGDEHYDEPYFYVSPYPYPDPAKLPLLPKLGHWHVKGFTAAIMPASRLITTTDQQAETAAFLHDAVAAARTAVS
jgi:uncharacterized protein DUF5996